MTGQLASWRLELFERSVAASGHTVALVRRAGDRGAEQSELKAEPRFRVNGLSGRRKSRDWVGSHQMT